MSIKSQRVLSILLVTIVLDQATKLIVAQLLPQYTSIPVIPNLFNLTHIRNSGAAFGILAGGSTTIRIYFLIAFSFVAIVFISHLLRRLPQSEKGLTVALTLVLGGAIGNLIDRVAYGEVIDFMDFYVSDFHWPAFNFADGFITVGVLAACYRLLGGKGDDPFRLS